MKLYFKNYQTLNKENIEYLEKHYSNRYQKAISYKQEEDCLLSLTAAYLLTVAFPKYQEKDYVVDGNGKPSIILHNSFNISHSGEFACLAVSEEDVGIDLEQIDEKNLRILDRIASEEEKEWINQNKIDNFHIYWTKKEALFKCIGTGISSILQRIDISPLLKDERILINDNIYYGKTIQIENYYCSIVSPKPIMNLEIINC